MSEAKPLWRRPFDALLDLVYPRRCLICGAALDGELEAPDDSEPSGSAPDGLDGRDIFLCLKCRKALVTPEASLCPFCSGSDRLSESEPLRCGSCRGKTFRFERIIALGPYRGPLRSRILTMKGDSSGDLARDIARLLYFTRTATLRSARCDRVIPVPRHYLRRWRRGADDAAFLADELARQLAIPCDARSLRRIRATEPQASVRWNQRVENVAGAFAVRPKRSIGANRPFEGERILLADDILTTGATADEITRVLLQAGAAAVTVAVCARAEGSQRGQK